MSKGQLGTLLQHLRTLVRPCPCLDGTDGQLLGRFVRDRDETAFEALLQRHGPMVWGVCRRLLRDEADAEDAFQGTFLVLARKAGSIRDRQSLAGWLYRVAYRLALHARADVARRKTLERDLSNMLAPGESTEQAWHDLRPVLDEELQRLPEKYRLPVVLCYLEGKTHEEAAGALGWPKGTVAGRLARARDRLRVRLRLRGITLSAALLGATLAEQAGAAPVPAALAVDTARLVAAGQVGATASARAEAWATAVLHAMTSAKVKAVAGLLMVLGIVAGGGVLVARAVLGGERPAPPPTGPVQRVPDQRAAAPEPAEPTLPAGAVRRFGTLRWRHAEAYAMAFLNGGQTVVSAGSDALRFWDVRTGRQTRAHPLHLNAISVIAFSADASAVAACSYGELSPRYLGVWETTTGKLRRKIPVDKPVPLWLRSVALSADGRTLAAGFQDQTVRVWDVGSGKELHRLRIRAPDREATSLLFSPDGKWLAAGSSMGQSAWLWEVQTGKRHATMRLDVQGLHFTRDSRAVLMTGTRWNKRTPQPTFITWDVATGKEIRALARKNGVYWLALSPDEKTLAWFDKEGMHLGDPVTLTERHRLAVHVSPAGAFSPDGRTLACVGARVIRLWDVRSGKELYPSAGHQGEVNEVAFSPDGKLLASASWEDHTVRLWDVATGRQLRVYEGQELSRGLAFSADGKGIVSRGVDNTLRLWDVATGSERRRLAVVDVRPGGKGEQVLGLRRTDDGKRLLSLSTGFSGRFDNFTVTAWDPATGKRLFQCPVGPVDPYSDFSPDGRFLATPRGRGIELLDVRTGKGVLTLHHQRDLATPLTFSPDGRLLAVATFQPGDAPGTAVQPGSALGFGRTQTLGLWEVASGQEVVQIPTGPAGMISIAPDGRVLASVGADALRFWDVATGKELGRHAMPGATQGSFGAPSFAACLAWSSDGRLLATGLPDSTVLLWDATARAPRRAVADVRPAALEGWWTDLEAADARRAYAAVWGLVGTPDATVRFLEGRLRPAPRLDAAHVQRLVARLDDKRFAARETAQAELVRMGEDAEPVLHRALQQRLSPEARHRIEAILALPRIVRFPALLRSLRAVQALESIGTSEARQLLCRLAQGDPAARLTREAKASLERLARRVESRR